MAEWDAFVAHSASLADEVNIALVGKYVQLPDAYLSVNESLDHAGIFHDHKVNVRLGRRRVAHSRRGRPDPRRDGRHPGARRFRGARHRGQDLVRRATPARTSCRTSAFASGCRVAVAEFARAMWPAARRQLRRVRSGRPSTRSSTSCSSSRTSSDMGGTMRLGTYPCTRLCRARRAFAAYGDRSSSTSAIATATRSTTRYRDRARGRRPRDQRSLSPDGKLVEMVELPDHPWFLGNPGASRVQEPAHSPAAAVPRLHRCGGGPGTGP